MKIKIVISKYVYIAFDEVFDKEVIKQMFKFMDT